MPFVTGERQRTDRIRVAPSYSTSESDVLPLTAYTLTGLAAFLGFVKPKSQEPTSSFVAAFGAEELIADGVLRESQIKGLSAERLGELAISVRKQRDIAKAADERRAAEAKKRAGGRVDFIPRK